MRSCKRMSLVVGLLAGMSILTPQCTFCAAAGFSISDVQTADNQGGTQNFRWVYVPDHDDWVSYAIINNQIVYIDPARPRQLLPKGLYFWRNKHGLYTLTKGATSTRKFTWAPEANVYIDAGRLPYDPSRYKYNDPAEVVGRWRQAENARLSRDAKRAAPRQQQAAFPSEDEQLRWAMDESLRISPPQQQQTYGAASVAAAAPSQQVPAPGQVLWKNVPERNDAVAYTVIGNKIMYVHPDNPAISLPKGLYVWKNKQQKIRTPRAQRTAAYTVATGNKIGTKPFVWSQNFNNYVTWDSTLKHANIYDASQARFEDPSETVAKWRQQENARLAQPLIVTPGAVRATPSAMPRDMLNRDKLFEDIMGMPEGQFQSNVGTIGIKPDTKKVEDWFNRTRLPARAQLIKQGNWYKPTLKNLRQSAQFKLQKPKNTGSLQLIVHDDQDPSKSDIRYLHQRFPNAFFMLASTFRGLEGEMGNYQNNLALMNKWPAQGEEASLATMPAVIYRRYFEPEINLIGGLSSVFKLGNQRGSPVIFDLNKSLPITSTDLGSFAVGVHSNIAVTSGHNPDGKMIPRSPKDQRLKPAYNQQLDGTLRVSHIVTAAHDINPKHDKKRDQKQQAIARAILFAAYEATLLAAIDSTAQTLVLTMLGTSAFANNPDWVVEAIQRLEDIIIASGIQVHLVVRHSDPKIQGDFKRQMEGIIREIETKRAQYQKDPGALAKNIQKFFATTEHWI